MYNFIMVKKDLSHTDERGRVRMVDVGPKPVSERLAIARGEVIMKFETFEQLRKGVMKKGDVLTVAQIAGVMGAKRTADLIPLCHPIPLGHIDVELELDEGLPGVQIRASVLTEAKTGVEMEALTAVSVAALTIYDMVKSIERTVRIANITLVEKRGGTSGEVINE
ncbi:MAG: cyclic pyranopterin monophosphate synthase MoaC [Chloroflexota bacterium]